jgi:hypothetical protein
MPVLAFTGDEWLALAGLAAGALGTLGGLVFAYFNRKAEQQHARELSRSERLHAQRRDAYVQLAAFLERMRLWAYRTEPFMGPQPDPPTQASDDEWTRLSGLAAVAGSLDVQSKMNGASKRLRDFEIAVLHYRTGRDERFVETRRQMEDARQAAFAAITEVQEAMRDELANL